MPIDRAHDTPSPSRAGGSLLAVALATLLAAARLWWPAFPSAAAAGPELAPPSPTETAAAPGVAPGDDFYAYANDAWLRAAVLPDGKERWGVRDELEAEAERRRTDLLAAAAAAPAGTEARAVADFRAAYADTGAIEAAGLRPLRPLLDRVARIGDRSALARELGRSLRADVDPLGFGTYQSASVLGLAVGQSIHGEPDNVAFLVQGGLGLPERDDYLSPAPGKQALRARYREHVRALLALAGFDGAAARADAVLALETALAEGQATREASANDRNADQVWSRADFPRRAAGLDWTAFLAAAGLAEPKAIAVWQPSAVTALAAQVAARPLAAWQDYLRFHALHDAADVLPRAFAEEGLAWRATVAPGPVPSRDARARAATEAAMRDALGRMYVARWFPAARKAHAEEIGEAVRAALLRRLADAAWMSPATRQSALAKLRTVYLGLGYPEGRDDGDAPRIDAGDALGNQLRVAARDRRDALARLGRPVDLHHWHVAPQSVGAILVFQQNSYVMAAALLEPPKYDASSEAAAYGSLGALVGHDLTHYVDTLGADYDVEHRLRRWWTPDDLGRFETLTRPLVRQFAAYEPLPGLAIDGELTLTENVADLGGLAAAFDAYRAATAGLGAEPAAVRDDDRAFFLAYARTQRRIVRASVLRAQIAGNDHAPEEARAATVRNLDAWYAAFDVRPGQRLYLEPAARVRVW